MGLQEHGQGHVRNERRRRKPSKSILELGAANIVSSDLEKIT